VFAGIIKTGEGVSDIITKAAGFLLRRSIRAEERPRDTRSIPERARPRITQPIFGPADESVRDRSIRHFGEWEAKGDPIKPAPKNEMPSGEPEVFYPKFREAAASSSEFQEPKRDFGGEGFLNALDKLVEEKRRK